MKSVRELAIVRFKSKFKEKVGSIYIRPDFAVNELDYSETIAELVAIPDYTGDFPSTIKVGDTVRCEYGTMDDKNPLDISEEGEGVCYHAHLSEILYKINPEDGTPEMQHGWILGRGLPVINPDWAVGHETISGIPYWKNSAGHCIEKINLSGQKNRMKVYGIGLIKPSLNKDGQGLGFGLGDIVVMEDECEFTNHNNNEILGRKYWFVRQEDIIGVIRDA